MTRTTKTVLLVCENGLTSLMYTSDPLDSMRHAAKPAKKYLNLSKKATITARHMGEYLSDMIYSHSVEKPTEGLDTRKQDTLYDYVAAMRDLVEHENKLVAPVAIMFNASVNGTVFCVTYPWDYDPEKFEEMKKQDEKRFYLMGVEILVSKMRDDGNLRHVNDMNDCYMKREIKRIVEMFGWQI